MDKIVPHEGLPPALEPSNYESSAQLTDRFGFFFVDRNPPPSQTKDLSTSGYTASERRATIDDASSITSVDADGRPSSANGSIASEKENSKKWYDWLKPAKYRPSILKAELLLNTPVSAPFDLSLSIQDKLDESENVPLASPSSEAPQVIISDRPQVVVSASTNPQPATARIFARYAEFTGSMKKSRPRSVTSIASAQTTSSGSNTASKDALKSSLLKQMNDLHDTVQAEKSKKWNALAVKVRAQQARKMEKEASKAASEEGDDKQITSTREALPEIFTANGDLNEYVGFAVGGQKEFNSLVFEGIPVARRAPMWLSRAAVFQNSEPGIYEDIIANNLTSDFDTDIDRDITRTMDENRFFRHPGPGRAKLREVLVAFARQHPAIGYVQGLNLIASYLLLVVQSSEEAFLLMEFLLNNIMPAGYYTNGLVTSRADASILRDIVAERLPALARHFEALDFAEAFEITAFSWFLSLFTNLLSAEALYRVWDVVFCLPGGSTFVFPVALSLLKLNEERLLGCETREEVGETLTRGMTGHVLSIDSLMRGCWELRQGILSVEKVEERRKRVREEQGLGVGDV